MKKLIGLISIILVSGCSEPIGQISKEGMKNFKSDNVSGYRDVYSDNRAGILYRVVFDGHIYIVRSDNYQGGICHDPDCSCYQKALEKIER